jgi:hypothetical protein
MSETVSAYTVVRADYTSLDLPLVSATVVEPGTEADPPAGTGGAATRWLRLYLEHSAGAGLDDAAFAVGALAALGGPHHDAALPALRDMAERAF